MPKGQLFSGEFKQRVVEDVLKNHISYNEAMKNMELKVKAKSRNGNEFTSRKVRQRCI